MIGKVSLGGRHSVDFDDVISIENLFRAWREFRRGKQRKVDVAAFELNLESNLFALHDSLAQGKWKPDSYVSFFVRDPKLRRIHKASVRDRVLYQALYRKLYPVFDVSFIYDSYSSRLQKGTHLGVKRLEVFSRKATHNFTRNAYVLKCDIKKFFDSIDHPVLISLIAKKIGDPRLLELIKQVIYSFETKVGKGLPLGNVTSQLFANIYLNELDQYLKHTLKARYYIRYCDDFVILSPDKGAPSEMLRYIVTFLREHLRLTLHPDKISITPISHGVDFLGYVTLPHYRVLRTRTKRRVFARINSRNAPSYLGLLTHCKGKKLEAVLKNPSISVTREAGGLFV